MNVNLMAKVLAHIRGDLRHFNLRRLVTKPSERCGTVACVIGWACTMPEAEAAGYSVKYSPALGDLGVFKGAEALMTCEFAEIGVNLFDVTEGTAFNLFCVPGESQFDSVKDYIADSPAEQLAVFERRLAHYCEIKGIDPTPFDLPQR